MNPTARRLARQYALQGMYQWQLSHALPNDIVLHLMAKQFNKKTDVEFFRELIFKIPEKHQELNNHFIPFLSRPVDELDPIELAILWIGTYELAYRLDIPYRVSINEALELTKKFGSIEGYKFVNGVLDQVARQLRAIEIANAKK